MCVSQYRKKGRFVVVLSSHLRCSPFTRHRFSYKLCDCECVGRRFEKEWCPLCPHVSPCTPFWHSDNVPSPLLRARSTAQLLQNSPLAEIVLFNKHTETAFRPRFFICFPQTRKKKYRECFEEREGVSFTNTHTHTQGRTISNSWQGAVWLVRRGVQVRGIVCFFLIQSEVMFIEAENDWSPTEWLDPCQEKKGGKKTEREEKENVTQLVNWRFLKIYNLVSFLHDLWWNRSLYTNHESVL